MRIAQTPIGWPLAAMMMATTAASGTAVPVAAQVRAQPAAASPVLQVNTGRGRLITLTRPMSDVFIASDAIADVQVRSPTQLYVFGKAPGETTISATSKSGAVVYSATIRVGNNFDSIQSMLNMAMPGSNVVATSMNGLILLTGTTASPADGAEAERLVQAFVGDGVKVISRLRSATPLQVNLQVRFAEVSRSFVKNVGVRLRTNDCVVSCSTGFLGSAGNPGSITYDPTTGLKKFTLQEGAQRSTLGLFGRALGTDFLAALDLGETVGQVSTLANPNLTAMSGETGTFLAGGEIPIPLSQGLGAVSVEYKQYGISLSYTPTVLADGRISLRLRAEVSQLTSAGAVQISGTVIPAISTRRTETTVELGSGQSFMTAGLLQNSHDNNIEKTPGLGDVPILGALFRSNGFKRNETELVIVVTPYLVKPVNANDIVLPTDGYQAPTDIERILLGKLGGPPTGGTRPKPSMAPSGTAVPAFGAVAPALPAPRPDTRRDEKAPSATARKTVAPTPGFSFN